MFFIIVRKPDYRMKLSQIAAILIVPSLWAGNTTALFSPGSATAGPFPTDSVTTTDATQITGKRINLPMPVECATSPTLSSCANTLLLNQLDGFSVNPRVTVCFSDAVNPASLAAGIQLFPIGPNGPAIAVNQVIYDPASNCAYAKPNAVLNQDSKYLLAVTQAVQDLKGQKLQQNSDYSSCVKKAGDSYCSALSQAVNQSGQSSGMVSASVFTTMSATAWLQQARAFVYQGSTPSVVLPAGPVSVFNVSDLDSINWVPQDQNGNTPQAIPLSALQGVGQIAFGMYLSPIFLNTSGPLAGSISVTPTGAAVSGPPAVPLAPGLPPGYAPVSFHVFVPSSPMPAGGYPVVIYGHGLGDNQFGAPTYIASTLALQGYATVAIEITGHGYGPGGTVQLRGPSIGSFTVAAPGRGIAFSPAPIGPTDGCILPGPLAVRDCGRQTVVDLFALTRLLQTAGGLGLLNPSRIDYVGQSFGSTYGAMFHAVEPGVSRAVLNGAGGTSSDVSRLALSGRPLATAYLGGNNPSLLNVPPASPQAYFHDGFNDNYVFRGPAAVVNNVSGAMPIQAAFEVVDWLGMLGDPLAYAGHLSTAPLHGVPAKATLFQFGLGDLEVPNPTEAAMVRAAGATNSAWLLRTDLAAIPNHTELLGITMPGAGGLPILPHRVLSNPTIFSDPAETALALAEQKQVAAFFSGQPSPDPNQFLTNPFSPAMQLFQPLTQVPAALLDQLNFLQIAP